MSPTAGREKIKIQFVILTTFFLHPYPKTMVNQRMVFLPSNTDLITRLEALWSRSHIAPVSYTHLDVYKRQIYSASRGPGREASIAVMELNKPAVEKTVRNRDRARACRAAKGQLTITKST